MENLENGTTVIVNNDSNSIAFSNEVDCKWVMGTTSTAIVSLNNRTNPRLIETKVLPESIEMIYMEEELVYTSYLTNTFSNRPERYVYKIVYSCVDGKWNVSDKIYGEIIPATSETYEFND